jgi:hypothetical protein
LYHWSFYLRVICLSTLLLLEKNDQDQQMKSIFIQSGPRFTWLRLRLYEFIFIILG